MIEVPGPSSDIWKILGTTFASAGAVKAWFHRSISKKLNIKDYENDKKLIAAEGEVHLHKSLKPIHEALTEVQINLRFFFEKEGMKYHKKDE